MWTKRQAGRIWDPPEQRCRDPRERKQRERRRGQSKRCEDRRESAGRANAVLEQSIIKTSSPTCTVDASHPEIFPRNQAPSPQHPGGTACACRSGERGKQRRAGFTARGGVNSGGWSTGREVLERSLLEMERFSCVRTGGVGLPTKLSALQLSATGHVCNCFPDDKEICSGSLLRGI